ncbi:SprT family zinc-dependent metalloprotease [Aspergillus clavatus NRRL 1]|uniref:SprT family metallopeptidase, putative n=1 Tax=Aspergillus clavatus (strain ATCC 1007 / CBS 513.65 / DSM 816 / NCTC 3887 / NRRL 1 / QM 1276 / 107) TaxID=344612 RepID=A1CU84_ASPCL|nr:SprT family metallopeptidase, putative [Aspergillus clavatus NRRL 1]EAW06871.1 SprT family metallopeptidase, putative [Aspergillus clavatus NRRL 1]
MARLNATPAKRVDARRLTKLSDKKGQHISIRRLFGERFPTAAADTDRQEQWTTTKETHPKQRSHGLAERRPLERSGSQRSGKTPIASFDILPDSDGLSDVDHENDFSPRLARGDKPKPSKPLKLAHVNSLLLPLSQQPRNRPAQKLETYDYAKENDPVDEEEEDTTPTISRHSSNASTRQSPARRNARQDRAKDGDHHKFLKYRQTQETVSEDDDGSHDDSLGSLEDFIVSDDEELSYHATSEEDSEEEEIQKKVISPPRPRRRLMRGRRQNLEVQVEEALAVSYGEELRLEPSLPAAMTVPASKLQVESKRWSQKDGGISEEIHNLTLEDNDPADQLPKDLFEFTEDSASPAEKLQEVEVILGTPPPSPSKSLLRSPTKERIHIPPTPYRESVDAFWSQEVINDWVDRHSPRKEGAALEHVLREFDDSDADTSGDTRPDNMRKPQKGQKEPKTPSKTALKRAETEKKKADLARKKSFDEKKAQIASDFLKVLDDAVSGGQVQKLAEETGGVRIVWSKSLLTTAGRAVWKRERTEKKPRASDSGSEPSTLTKQHATIELAERIIDNEHRLLNTLAHEYCHLANYMISNVHNNPHGASFKQWGRRCKEALKDHPVYGGQVEVTTKHSYQIDYKYVWSCVDCGQNYGRHSKSIDTTKSRCGKCKGLLQQIKPKPRNVSPRKKPLQSSERFEKKTVEDVAGILGEVSLYS